jgi:hypothetical protein
MSKKEIVQTYYNCFEKKDRATLEKILKEDFKFTSSYVNYTNRDEMLDDIWPQIVINTNKIVDLEIFENGNRFMVKYSNGRASVSEFIRLDGNKIAETKVFIGKESKSNNN